MPESPTPNLAPAKNARLLLMEADAGLSEILKSLLRSMSCRVLECRGTGELPALFNSRNWDAVLCNLQNKNAVCQLAAAVQPPVPVVLLASYAESQAAADAVSAGEAAAWLSKPLRTELALKTIKAVLAKHIEENAAIAASPAQNAQAETAAAQEESVERHFGLMVGTSEPMQALYRQIEKVAASNMTVLILGESGTGKELVAKALHAQSDRAAQPFIPVNCSSLPENLLESELFGYIKGAFTGAVHNKDGLFVAANGGTLFLDEIGSIPLSTQLALLRALQEREIRPVGSTQPIPVNVRVLAATNEDLDALMQSGRLRQDLYYRISAFTLKIPPLRQRTGDLELLAREALRAFTPPGSPRLQLEPAAMAALTRHSWPGNIREFMHALERGATLAEGGVIRLKDLPAEIVKGAENRAAAPALPAELPADSVLTLKAYLRMCERRYLAQILEQQHGDKEQTAKLLGVSVATLYRKLSEL